MSIGCLGAVIWPCWTIYCGEPLRISVTLSIQRRFMPFLGLKPKQSKMYWKIRLIEWGSVRPAMAVIWMMLCFILKWKGLIFLIKPYFWKNIHKFFFYSRFKFQILDGPPCTTGLRSDTTCDGISLIYNVQGGRCTRKPRKPGNDWEFAVTWTNREI